MSARTLCPRCGWTRTYRDPAFAHLAAEFHDCLEYEQEPLLPKTQEVADAR